jgi:hypothetical protein
LSIFRQVRPDRCARWREKPRPLAIDDRVRALQHHPGMTTGTSLRTFHPLVLSFALSLTLSAGCDPGTPLAEMVDKSLQIRGTAGSGGYLRIELMAMGCPQVTGDLEATLNGRPMIVEPGRKGEPFFDKPCYYPVFRADTLTADLGPTLEIVIRDRSQTVRARIADYQPETPQPEKPGPPREVTIAERVSIPLAPTATPPDMVTASLAAGDESSPGYCKASASAPAVLANGRVEVTIPRAPCAGKAKLYMCVGYRQEPRLETCENATCTLQERFATRGCEVYPLIFR